MGGFSDLLEAELSALRAAGLFRACPEVSGADRVHIELGGKPRLSFCSNDYLGLSNHPRVLEAAAAAAVRNGFGASASRLVSGDLPAHRQLEAGLASFLGRPAALLFPTGYQANLGVLTALAGPDDLIVSDALNHASLIDGCRLARAKIAVYPHLDTEAARRCLADGARFRRRFLVTESLFSMDGDVAPLAALAEIARAAEAILIVDEAHALGVLGPGGRGLAAAAGVVPDVLVGTLGKAFGAAGGFVAGEPALRDFLVNRARTFIFTTAPPPSIAGAAAAALQICASPEGDRRRADLDRRRVWIGERLVAAGLREQAPAGPIVPIVLGSEARALEASSRLAERGLFVAAIRPPTVPPGSARLRVTLSASHEMPDLARLMDALGEACA